MNFFLARNPKQDHSTTIHVCLSAALYLLNMSFLLNEWLANMNQNGVCKAIAILMHYFLLCCFSWMAVEAIHLYLLMVKVFNTYIRHYIAKLSLFGWGKSTDDLSYSTTILQNNPAKIHMEGVPPKMIFCEQHEMYQGNRYRSRTILHGTELTLSRAVENNPFLMCGCDKRRGGSPMTRSKTLVAHTCDVKRWMKRPVVVFAEPVRAEPGAEFES
ncbi:UNVERIFIED_CONTAM: hypothetical protein FKN15_060647 [Acipenser sinensis]